MGQEKISHVPSGHPLRNERWQQSLTPISSGLGRKCRFPLIPRIPVLDKGSGPWRSEKDRVSVQACVGHMFRQLKRLRYTYFEEMRKGQRRSTLAET
jgi:hypothetical protein